MQIRLMRLSLERIAMDAMVVRDIEDFSYHRPAYCIVMQKLPPHCVDLEHDQYGYPSTREIVNSHTLDQAELENRVAVSGERLNQL